MQATIGDFLGKIISDPKLCQSAAGLDGLVTGMTVRRDGQLLLECLLQRPCPADLLCQLESALEEHLPAGEVIICQRYGKHLSPETSSQYAASLSPWLIRHLWKRNAILASVLAQAEFCAEQDRVQIHLHDACCSMFEEAHLNVISELFCEHVNARTTFSLIPAGGDMLAYTRQMNEGNHYQANKVRASALADSAGPAGAGNSAAAASGPMRTSKNAADPKKMAQSTPPGQPAKTFRRQPKPEGVIWGRIRPELSRVPISALNSESGLVLLEGEVFDLESREVSNGTRILIKFSLTDFTNSVGCIIFAKPDEREKLEESLKNAWIRLNAEIAFDSQFAKDLQAKVLGIQEASRQAGRQDTSPQKRIELHAHTKMSTKDSVCDAAQMVRLAASFGHPAIAVTDHGVVQSFPDAAEAKKGLRKKGTAIKIIYGLEGYLVDDGQAVAWLDGEASLDNGFVAIDVETTGLDPAADRIIEAAAVLFEPDGQGGFNPTNTLTSLINPGIPVSARSQELTGISTEMLQDAPEPLEFLEKLLGFIGGRPVVAHNAFFDLSFLRYEGFRIKNESDPRLKFNPPLIDTLALARIMLPELPNHKLNTVTEHLKINLERHHRAEADAIACGRIFDALWRQSGADSLQTLNQLSGHQSDEQILEHKKAVFHIILLAADSLGLYNLYRLISLSHTRYFHSRPRIPKSLLQYFKAGLILGSACEAGEVFQAVLAAYQKHGRNYAKTRENLGDPELVRLGRFYDYLEIQPTCNNRFYLRDPKSGLQEEEDLLNLNRLVVDFADRLKKPVCATGDVHFLEKKDGELRKILLTDMGYEDAAEQADLYYRTTDEMLAEFAYLGESKAQSVVIDNPARIAARISDDLKPFPDGSFPPIIASAAEDIRQLTWDTAKATYGRDGELPEIVRQRIERELRSIIDNGFAIMYYIAHKLVKKSNDDGYIVGSRGSVGSSLVATLCGITEVNPLAPHYICPHCHYSEFDESGEFGSGYDLPDKNCPECKTSLHREGQDIPFETFLGFNGDKQPDIDLNFSGEYQARAHKFIEEMFGSSHTFRAGTIGGYAEKNAQAMVANYFRGKEQYATQAEINRLSRGLIGVKRTTGQHPGGIVVVPKERDVYDFTPVQFPADKTGAGTVTTHFDFNAMHDTILKLDILGHDDPTMLKMLGDLTSADVRTIPIPDKKVMSLFQSTEALGIPDGSSPADSATLGLPELGTFMAREMIRETKPSRFFDLVQLMGLSHGTDVWKGNAQELIRSGICTIEEVIGCRDSIMTWLIYNGLPPKASFDIMEKVRKGKGLSPEHEQLMHDHNVPQWYIDSCKKIRYMFPKAHAAAYTISSLRIAWFKVNYPEEYYCAYFTVRADEFDSKRMCQPAAQIRQNREKLRAAFREAPDREQKIYYILELVEEMQLRGIDFLPIDLYESEAVRFIKVGKGLIRPPLNAIPSISTAIAESIVKARADGIFKSRDELMRRAEIGQSAIETLAEAGCLKDMPESSQIDLFEWMK